MACSDGLIRRPLTEADIGRAHALSADAGWNQVPADWHLMLRNGEGIAVTAPDGTLAATALTHRFGSIGWISMVLVARVFRRRGIATDLISRCLGLLQARAIMPGLDATEAGRLVYEPLGFQPVYTLSRRVATVTKEEDAPVSGVRAATAADLDRIAAYDAEVFGLDRAHILRGLSARAPSLAQIAERNGTMCGFVLGRDGRRAVQIGPLSAENPETAIALVRAALGNVDGLVYLDSLDGQDAFNDYLLSRGFTVQRGFTRMLLGRSTPFDDPRRTFAIAGPELA
jgi:GNAT superfamily N-acetyltransferase